MDTARRNCYRNYEEFCVSRSEVEAKMKTAKRYWKQYLTEIVDKCESELNIVQHEVSMCSLLCRKGTTRIKPC